MFLGKFFSAFLIISKTFIRQSKTDYLIPLFYGGISSLIFICVTLYAKRLSRPLNQRFLITYSSLIFVCANCARFSPQPTIFNSAGTTYFLYVWHASTPQTTFYSGIFTAYLCMILVCAKLSQNPPLFISESLERKWFFQ